MLIFCNNFIFAHNDVLIHRSTFQNTCACQKVAANASCFQVGPPLREPRCAKAALPCSWKQHELEMSIHNVRFHNSDFLHSKEILTCIHRYFLHSCQSTERGLLNEFKKVWTTDQHRKRMVMFFRRKKSRAFMY